MIRDPRPADLALTTTRAHVETVAATEGLDLIPAGEWLYAVRKVPLLGQPIIMRCRVEVATRG